MLLSFKDSWSVKHEVPKANSLADNLKTCVCQARKQNRFIWELFKWNQLKCLTPSRSAKKHREFFVEGIHWLVFQTNACLNNHRGYFQQPLCLCPDKSLNPHVSWTLSIDWEISDIYSCCGDWLYSSPCLHKTFLRPRAVNISWVMGLAIYSKHHMNILGIIFEFIQRVNALVLKYQDTFGNIVLEHINSDGQEEKNLGNVTNIYTSLLN